MAALQKASEMVNYVGTAGDDTITGPTGADNFDMSQGGDDTVYGMGGKDLFYYGATLTAADHIDGGTLGSRQLIQGKVELNGDYSAGVVFGTQTMVNVATLQLDGGNDYNLTLASTTVNYKYGLTVDASALGPSDTLILDGSPSRSGLLTVVSNAGHVEITGSSYETVIDLGSSFNSGDRIVGNGLLTWVEIAGDYSAGMKLTSNIVSNVQLHLDSGTYNFTTDDSLVGAGQQFSVTSQNHNAHVTFDGSAETDGGFAFYGLNGVMVGGGGADNFDYCTGTMTSGTGDVTIGDSQGVFHLEQSGKVTATLGTGNETFYMGASFDAADSIAGGPYQDTVILDGNYSSKFVLSATNLTNVEVLQLTAGHSYNFTTNDANVAKGATMTVDGSALGVHDRLTLDGGAEKDGNFILLGGLGRDKLIAGTGSDTLNGGGSADILNGGTNGNDNFVYAKPSDSTGLHYDTIIGFDVTRDVFTVANHVGGVDAIIATGALNNSSAMVFNHDLAAAADAAHLLANHAVVFEPDSGTLAGDIFLVIDQNGVAGYQAGHDLVIEISGSSNIASIGVDNFH